MKLNRESLPAPEPREVVFPRQKGNIVLKVGAVLDAFEQFKKRYSKHEPKPPVKTSPGGVKEEVLDHPEYQKKMDQWSDNFQSWMIYESLKATPGLEFELVDESNYDTLPKIKEELRRVFSDGEVFYLMDQVTKANMPDEKDIKESVKAFASLQAQE